MGPMVKCGRYALSSPLDQCSNLEVSSDRCSVTPVKALGCLDGRIGLDLLIGLPVAVMPLLAQSHPIRDHTLTMIEL